MPTVTDDILHKITSGAGWHNSLVKRESYKLLTGDKFSFQYYISHNAFNDDSLKLDAIYFTEANPVIYIKQLMDYNPDEIIKIQKRFWNECRTPLTLIITPGIVKILDNYARPVNTSAEISEIELKTYTTSKEDLERLVDLLKQSDLDTEKVLGNSLKLNVSQRVDKKLISQLREARKQLHNKYKLDFDTIHDLLGRSLFTLYLEQRNILTKRDIKLETKVSDNFFDLLLNHSSETYTLFTFLREKFNGDLFPITTKEISVIEKNPDILNLIYYCFTGRQDLNTGQSALFNLFDFKHIPIELISAIYEEFMSEEDVVNNKIRTDNEKGKRELGAYYTPQMLVEFVYNEILPMPSKNDCNFNVKILDPACGSGIFLVEGFKRIIERWKFANQKSELDETTLVELLQNNIFGIEIHPEAIKITAFSLYLTFLQHMNPRDILRKVKFKPLVYWTKQEETDQRSKKTVGLNLLQANTFIRESKSFQKNPDPKVISFFDTQFNIVIGNPPWKSGNVADEIKIWAKKEGWNLERDIIKGFLAYAPYIAPKANIALLTSVKVLFNTSGTDDNFRLRFFSENKVSVVANFAAVRQVLFEKAKQGAALIIYKSRNHKEINPNESIIYCVPKTTASIQNRRTITIDGSEIKYLPIQEVLKANSKVFKIAMYGNIRDLKFVNKLRKIIPIEEFVGSKYKGIGLHIKESKKPFGNVRLANNYFIPSNKIQQYTITSDGLTKLGRKHLQFRRNNEDIFSAPTILLNEGTKNSKFCATLVEFDCAFLKSSYGFTLRDKNMKYLKALTVCLNSSLANYYFITISSSWGVDRYRVINKEAMSFPLITEILNPRIISLLANNFDKIQKIKFSKNVEFNVKAQIKLIKKRIDKIIFEELKITKNEQCLIEHLLSFCNVIRENYMLSGAEEPVIAGTNIKQYTQTYLEVVNKHFKHSSIHLRAELFSENKPKTELICIKFIFEKNISNMKDIEETDLEVSNILEEINNYTFKQHSSSIYFRRIIKYDLKNSFYLIKPNEQRFWTKALALNDADNLIVEILNQDNN